MSETIDDTIMIEQKIRDIFIIPLLKKQKYLRLLMRLLYTLSLPMSSFLAFCAAMYLFGWLVFALYRGRASATEAA